MDTQAMSTCKRVRKLKVCEECIYRREVERKGKPCLLCTLSGRLTLPPLAGCYYWKGSVED